MLSCYCHAVMTTYCYHSVKTSCCHVVMLLSCCHDNILLSFCKDIMLSCRHAIIMLSRGHVILPYCCLYSMWQMNCSVMSRNRTAEPSICLDFGIRCHIYLHISIQIRKRAEDCDNWISLKMIQ